MNRVVTISLLLLLSIVSAARADFAKDQYAPEPHALQRIISAAEQYGEPLRPGVDDNTSYYLRRAEYVGPCEASFDLVHVAGLFYVRSAPLGSKTPARSHSFVVFADRDFRIRTVWRVEFDLAALSVSGSKLRLGETSILDYKALPKSESVVVDGQLQTVPKWN